MAFSYSSIDDLLNRISQLERSNRELYQQANNDVRCLKREIEAQENKRWILAILARVQIDAYAFVDIDLSNVQFENCGQAWNSLPPVFHKDEVRQIKGAPDK